MKHLKKFENNSSYEEYILGEDFILPNVSYVEEDSKVYYNPLQSSNNDPYADWVKLTYNVTNVALPVDIFCPQENGGAKIFDIVNVTDMAVAEGDSRTATEPAVVTPAYQYTFSTTGEHTVYVKFGDMTKVPLFAFAMCTALVDCELPDVVTTIEQGAFVMCTGLTNITIPNSVQTIGEGVFIQCTGLTSVTIGSGVTTIGGMAFYECTGLMGTLTIPNGVTSIGQQAFVSCKGLTEIIIPNSVQTIAGAGFAGCKGITEIIIPNSVTEIGLEAFSGCDGLTSVTIGEGVQTIGDWAFANCSGLTTITSLATTAPSIEWHTFNSVKTGGTLFVPQGATGYDTWMATDNYYLGKYNWTMQTISE